MKLFIGVFVARITKWKWANTRHLGAKILFKVGIEPLSKKYLLQAPYCPLFFSEPDGKLMLAVRPQD